MRNETSNPATAGICPERPHAGKQQATGVLSPAATYCPRSPTRVPRRTAVSNEATGASGYPSVGGNPVAERMQALLSRAVEDQLSEQRTVANALAEVRAQVAAVGEGLRGAASGVAVERLRTDLGAVATELRMSTTGLGERFDILARRLDEQAATIAGAGSGTAELSTGLDALAGDVAAQGAAITRLTAAVSSLSSFPQALAGLQRDLTEMQEALA